MSFFSIHQTVVGSTEPERIEGSRQARAGGHNTRGKEGRGGGVRTRGDSRTSRKSPHCVSQHAGGIHSAGNSRERPHGNFRFSPIGPSLRFRSRCASPTRKFSYVPFTRRVRLRPTYPTPPRPFSESPSFRCLRLSIQAVHPRARRSVRRDTRKYTRARRGCISMYFYARVIAPTVYFYPTRVICNGPPSSIERAELEGRGRKRREEGALEKEIDRSESLLGRGAASMRSHCNAKSVVDNWELFNHLIVLSCDTKKVTDRD